MDSFQSFAIALIGWTSETLVGPMFWEICFFHDQVFPKSSNKFSAKFKFLFENLVIHIFFSTILVFVLNQKN